MSLTDHPESGACPLCGLDHGQSPLAKPLSKRAQAKADKAEAAAQDENEADEGESA